MLLILYILLSYLSAMLCLCCASLSYHTRYAIQPGTYLPTYLPTLDATDTMQSDSNSNSYSNAVATRHNTIRYARYSITIPNCRTCKLQSPIYRKSHRI